MCIYTQHEYVLAAYCRQKWLKLSRHIQYYLKSSAIMDFVRAAVTTTSSRPFTAITKKTHHTIYKNDAYNLLISINCMLLTVLFVCLSRQHFSQWGWFIPKVWSLCWLVIFFIYAISYCFIVCYYFLSSLSQCMLEWIYHSINLCRSLKLMEPYPLFTA